MNEARLPTFQRNAGAELEYWELSVKDAVRATALAAVLAGCLADRNAGQKDLSVIVSALSDKSLRSIQEC